MENDTPSDDPLADPGKAPLGDLKSSKRIPTPPSELEAERWWKAYKANPKAGLKKVSATVKASIHRVRHAVRAGWPDLGMPAFQDRLAATGAASTAAVHRVAQEVEAQAVAQVAKIVIGTWEESARAQLGALNKVTTALAKLAEQLDRASAGATFVSYRRVPDLDEAGRIRRDERGNAILIMKPFVSGHAVASAAARLAVAAKDHAMLGKVLLGTISPVNQPGSLSGPPSMVLMMPDSDDLQDPSTAKWAHPSDVTKSG